MVVTCAAAAPKIEKLKYKAFELDYSCAERSAIRWYCTLDKDTGKEPRQRGFTLDPDYPKQCQQLSTATYDSVFNRGHLVRSHDMDMDSTTMRQAHYMTNIVPQASRFNSGIWAATEIIGEYYRELNPIKIFGGLVYNDTSNDYFVRSHGIKTPDLFWKVITTKDRYGVGKAIAWVIPNQTNLTSLQSYRVSVHELEKQLVDGLGPIPIPESLKSDVTSNWSLSTRPKI